MNRRDFIGSLAAFATVGIKPILADDSAALAASKMWFKEAQFGIFISNTSNVTAASCYTKPVTLPDEGDIFEVEVTIPNHHLAKGLYKVDMNISSFNYQAFARDHDLVFGVLSFEVKHVDTAHTLAFTAWPYNLGSVCMTDTQVSLKSV